MVVVIIIALLAVIAIPSIVFQLRDSGTQQAAQEVAMLYRGARTRAIGRGAAILVRYSGNQLTVLEAVRGSAETDANCQAMPVSSCTGTSWVAGTDARQLSTFAPAKIGRYSDVQLEMTDAASQTVSALDVCFTPLGKTYVGTGGALSPLNGVPVARIQRGPDGDVRGLVRKVLILPNGAARLGVSEQP